MTSFTIHIDLANPQTASSSGVCYVQYRARLVAVSSGPHRRKSQVVIYIISPVTEGFPSVEIIVSGHKVPGAINFGPHNRLLSDEKIRSQQGGVSSDSWGQPHTHTVTFDSSALASNKPTELHDMSLKAEQKVI